MADNSLPLECYEVGFSGMSNWDIQVPGADDLAHAPFPSELRKARIMRLGSPLNVYTSMY